MNHIKLLFNICLSLVLLSMIACKNETKSAEYIHINKEGNYEDIIGFKTDKNDPQQAKIEFVDTLFEFGGIQQGEVVTKDFVFKNTGTKDLIILDTWTSCGCTIPSYPSEPIAPGKEGVIQIKFDSDGKSNLQEKKIKVYTNTYIRESILTLSGFVKTKK